MQIQFLKPSNHQRGWLRFEHIYFTRPPPTPLKLSVAISSPGINAQFASQSMENTGDIRRDKSFLGR